VQLPGTPRRSGRRPGEAVRRRGRPGVPGSCGCQATTAPCSTRGAGRPGRRRPRLGRAAARGRRSTV